MDQPQPLPPGEPGIILEVATTSTGKRHGPGGPLPDQITVTFHCVDKGCEFHRELFVDVHYLMGVMMAHVEVAHRDNGAGLVAPPAQRLVGPHGAPA